MDQTARTPRDVVLIDGLDDWIDLGWMAQCVWEATPGLDPTMGENIRVQTCALIADLLEQGLMVAGDIVDGVHVPWVASAADAATRIAVEWHQEWGNKMPTPGAITWLANTSAGDDYARELLAGD